MGARFRALTVWALALPLGAAAIGADMPAWEAGGIMASLADAGSSSRDARRDAIAAIPLERLSEADRQNVERGLRSATLYRRLPATTVTCSADLLDFLLAKPETIVDVWRTLGISGLSLDPAGPGQWRLADGYGTTGLVRLVHRGRSDRGGVAVYQGRGGYEGPLSPKPLTGSCVVVVRHAPTTAATDGRPRQTVQIDAFLDVDGLGLEIVTRTLQPLIVRSAAANVHEICLFVTQFAAAGQRNPSGIVRLTERLARTPPKDRSQLARLACSGSSRGGGDAADDVGPELAARWMTAEQLEALRIR